MKIIAALFVLLVVIVAVLVIIARRDRLQGGSGDADEPGTDDEDSRPS